MPTYTYNCAECGLQEFIHGMEEMLTSCPYCDSINFRKTFNKVAVQFKGSGFYSTDSKGK
jgi:putative FmdB family regulatory protein